MFFETKHSSNQNEFDMLTGTSLSFPLHLHQSFEFFGVTGGAARVTVEDKEYLLTENQAVLVFPYQAHSYKSERDCTYVLLLFSPDIVPDFYQKIQYKIPASNFFAYERRPLPETDTVFLQKALAYEICGTLDRSCTYISCHKKYDLLHQLLIYINENYQKQCLLQDAARCIQYDYAYISKFFKRTVGISFHAYVNRIRMQDASRLLQTTDEPVSRIAEQCGFSCIKTFHREFKRMFGTTPSAFRKKL